MFPRGSHPSLPFKASTERNSYTGGQCSLNETRISLLSAATGSIPDYLANTAQYYWFSYSPATRLLYFKYNVCENDPANPFSSFAATFFETLDANPVDTVVFDFRGNTGGDSSVINPLMNGVVDRLPSLRSRSSFRLYAAIDKGTFSSGLDDAEVFKQPSLAATVIGEPSGGKPAHFGNVASFTLPSSHIQGQYSQQFFAAPSYLPTGDSSLAPDVNIPIRSTDYFARFDPVMAAILARSSSLPVSPATASVTIVNAASSHIEQGIAPGSLATAFGTFSNSSRRRGSRWRAGSSVVRVAIAGFVHGSCGSRTGLGPSVNRGREGSDRRGSCVDHRGWTGDF